MYTLQTGQILPGSALYISLASGLGVTVTPAMSDFIQQAELTSIQHAQSALKKSITINSLISRASSDGTLVIDGEKVNLKHGYPKAKITELRKVADFGTQHIVQQSASAITIWSMYSAYCFTYTEATKSGGAISRPVISKIGNASLGECPAQI